MFVNPSGLTVLATITASRGAPASDDAPNRLRLADRARRALRGQLHRPPRPPPAPGWQDRGRPVALCSLRGGAALARIGAHRELGGAERALPTLRRIDRLGGARRRDRRARGR